MRACFTLRAGEESPMDEDLIDRIHECAFVPELWPQVLGELAAIALGRSGWMFVASDDQRRFVGSNERIAKAVPPLLESGEVFRSQRLAKLIRARHPGFLREVDLYTEDELEVDPFYQKYIFPLGLFPLGLGYAAATLIVTPTRERLVVSLERERARGPVETEAIGRLDALRPDLARSLMTAARLRIARAAAASATLESLGLPALMLDGNGRVLAANALMESLVGAVRWRTRDGVAFADRAADRLLREALTRLVQPEHRGVRSFPVRDDLSETMTIAHVVPVRLSARDILSRSDAALILTPLARLSPAPAELLQALFDLTPAESRLARSLVEGEPLEEIARNSGVSAHTTRVHLRSVLAKTGCHRQAELVSLLGGLRPAGA